MKDLNKIFKWLMWLLFAVSRCAAAAEVGKQRIVFPVAVGDFFRHRHHTGALLCAFTGIQDPAAFLHSCGGQCFL